MNRDVYLWVSCAVVAASIAVSVIDVHERARAELLVAAETWSAEEPAVVDSPMVLAPAVEPGAVVEPDAGAVEPGAVEPRATGTESTQPMTAGLPASQVAAATIGEPFARAGDEAATPVAEDAAAGDLVAGNAVAGDLGGDDGAAPDRAMSAEFAPPPAMAITASAIEEIAIPESAVGVAVAMVATALTVDPSAPPVSSPSEDDTTAAAALRTALAVTAPDHAAVRRPRAASQWTRRIGKDVDSEMKCLALNIYWEARSEPTLGRFAVAAVTLNRVGHRGFPDTVCGVVHQGEERGLNRCQFSWVCDGKTKTPQNAAAWREAVHIAYTMISLDLPDPTDGALWYHADYVSPGWARAMARVTQIGRHIYYRGVTRTAAGAERAAG